MVVNVTSLPSKGLTTKGIIQEFNLEPLTYKQLVKYTNKRPDNAIDKTVNEIECFIKDIQGWNLLSAYDLSTILFFRELISASWKDELTIPIDGQDYVVSISSITFKDINEELLQIKSIELNKQKYDFRIPTIEQYYNSLKAIQEISTQDDLWINKNDIMIMSALGLNRANVREVFKNYSDANGDDIITIKYLDRLLNNSANDITVKGSGGGQTVISVSNYITDIFQLIRHNRLLNTSKIKTRKTVQLPNK